MKTMNKETLEEPTCWDCKGTISKEGICFCNREGEELMTHIEQKEEPKQTDEKGKPLTYWGGLEEPNKTHYLDELPNMDRDVLAKMWESAIPKLSSKQETLEEAAYRLYPIVLEDDEWDKNKQYRDEWIEGAKWQQERMYSEEEVEKQKLEFAIGLLKVIEQPNGDLLGNKIKQQIIILEQKLSEL